MNPRIMNYKKHVFLFLLLLTCRVYAQDVHLKLYEQQGPKTDKIDSSGYIREVFSPELLGYLPENRAGLNHAVLLIPGGAYSYIAKNLGISNNVPKFCCLSYSFFLWEVRKLFFIG